jgi:hypothetical protein
MSFDKAKCRKPTNKEYSTYKYLLKKWKRSRDAAKNDDGPAYDEKGNDENDLDANK